MKKLYYSVLAALIVFAGCKKTDFDDTINGEALGTFATSAPADNAIIVLNSGTPTAGVSIEWAAATPGVNTAPTYKFQAALKGGNFETPYLEITSDNTGKTNKLTLTQKQLDDALKAKGVAEGAKVDLIWRVVATNGSVKVETATRNISITRMGDGVSNFVLYGPLSSNTSIVINPNSTTDFMNFKWQAAVAGKTGSAVTYKVKFVAAGGNFNTPLFEVVADNSGANPAATISYQKMDQLLTAAGYADQSTPAALQWTVEATSGTYKKTADYVNDINIVREVKLFIVGGATPIGWTPTAALQMIADQKVTGGYYIYVHLTPGGLKFLSEAADWSSPTLTQYGGSGTDGIVVNGGGDINVTTEGDYRVTVDLKNNKYYIQSSVMGAVGAATPAGWNPGAVFPTQALHLISTNKFLGFVNLTAGAEWKFIDGNDWGDGSLIKAKDFGKIKGSTDGIAQIDADNMTVPGATGLYRLVWDGTNIKNLKYGITPGTMFLIGAATAGGWDNSASNANLPAMTYMGNGVWKVTTDLTAGEFKVIFFKGNWDYNYGAGSSAGTISEGGANMSVATAGNYTITVDEFKRTYEVKKN